VGASVARCPRTPPDAAKTSGLQDRYFKPLTRPEQPEHSCRLQLLQWPDNGGTMPSKSTPFTPSSILFRPHMVEAPGTAPGSEWFITTAIYRHSRQAGRPNIGANAPRRKAPLRQLCKASAGGRMRRPGADSGAGIRFSGISWAFWTGLRPHPALTIRHA